MPIGPDMGSQDPFRHCQIQDIKTVVHTIVHEIKYAVIHRGNCVCPEENIIFITILIFISRLNKKTTGTINFFLRPQH